MYLVEANSAAGRLHEQPTADRPVTEPWENFPYSSLSHHDSACCAIAREWVLGMDFAQLNGADLSSGPRWLRSKYKWGPSSWPMHWCEVVAQKVIDCGAHAALSREAFSARGIVAFPAQLVQRYSKDATDQWQRSWTERGASCHWLDGEHIYHEATAVLAEKGEIKIWDGSSASWIDPGQGGRGYGSVLAIRIHSDPHLAGAGFQWGGHWIRPNLWTEIAA